MGYFRLPRTACALALFFVVMATLAGPNLYAVILWDAVMRVDGSTHRRRVAHWQSFWAVRMFGWISRIMGITADFSVPDDLRREGGPFIVISNHQSTLDILLLVVLLAKTGRRDLRWVLKRQLMSAPVIGRSCRETGCGYVARSGERSDLWAVRRCAVMAHADRASVMIFPEGTRYTGPKPDSEYVMVLPPKVGGFKTLREALPEYPVLSVTISWEGVHGGAKTMFQSGAFVGRRVAVECAVNEDIDDAEVVQWLHREWRRKDRTLFRKLQTGA